MAKANKDNIPEPIPEFTLEDIMKEFGSGSIDWDTPADSLGDTQVFTPVAEIPAEEEAPETEEIPAEEEAPEAVEVPAEEETPEAGEIPTEEVAPEAEEVPAEEEVPEAEEVPAEEETPEAEEVPTEEAPEAEEIPTEEEAPEAEEVPAEEETPEAEEVPSEEEEPEAGEIPTEEVAPEAGEIPTEEVAPEAEEVPTEEEAPEAEEIPAEEEEPEAEEVSAEEEASEAEEEPAEEEAPADTSDDTRVFTPVTVEDLIMEPEDSSEEEEPEAEEETSEEGEAPTEEAPAEGEEAPAEEAPAEEEEAPAEEEASEEADTPAREEVFTQEQIPAPKAIPFRSRLGELKRKLVAGPEQRYYDLSEIGVGRVQVAVFLNLLIVVLCTGGTALYAAGAIMENRLRLMIFSQILAMMVSALLGCYLLMDGIMDIFTGKFSLNSMLFLTLAACAADAVFCLRELRVPCCAAFSLEMAFALWNRSLRRGTEMGQMDTLRKANRLDALVKVKNFFGEESGIVRTEGRVEDFMDNYSAATTPEKALNIYALVSVLACAGIAVLAGMRHGLSLAVQVFSTSMLVAVPAGTFVSQSRPAAILERRLHMVGTVICGWQGVKFLCGKASFPLNDRDIFPIGSVKLNGVKFVGDIDPDSAIAAATALMRANGGGLESVFTQLLKSRNGLVYPADEVQILPNGISALVRGRSCLLGLQECMEEQGIQIPENALVEQAVYFAMGGQLAAVFALNYNRTRSSAGGLITLGSCRKIRPMVLAKDFTITARLLQDKFGIKTKRYDFPDRELRRELADSQPDPELIAGALSTQQHLASAAYAVSGAKSLRTASRVGMVLHIFAGVVGLLIMAALAYLGDMQLLSPFNILLYQLVWLVPGLLITEWTRTV